MRSFSRLLMATLLFAGCRDAADPLPEPPPPPPSIAAPCIGSCRVLDQITPITIATYDGSGQAVHPDVAEDVPDATTAWLALTPYPNGNANFENPTVYQAPGDATTWAVPAGAPEPIELPPEGAYLSDPDLVFDPARDRFRLYYRAVEHGDNDIDLVESSDGTQWSSPQQVLSAPSHQIVSPSVVRGSPGAPWTMWAVNAGRAGCDAASTTVERRTSADGVHWSTPRVVMLDQPGVTPWHIDVEWIAARNEYWAVYNTYPRGASCVTDALYLATSTDGIHWTTYPSPIMRRGVIDPLADIVYRSTFAYHADDATVTLWISGARYVVNAGYHWSIATITRRATDLLATAATPAASIAAPRRDLPPPEDDVTPESPGAM